MPTSTTADVRTPLVYRPDIDGLRALAVLAVVGFHASPRWVKGGFVGVDVFFVISGYLISSILLRSLEAGQFSIATFYVRRIRRIFPALTVVLVTTLGAGWFCLVGGEYVHLGKQIASGAGFVSNLALWSESGYFDVAAELKPLLHLWSLGIEEQFYICWPLILWLGWVNRWSLARVMAVLASVSFGISTYLTWHDTTAAFYAPYARFWELLVGCGLALVARRRSGVGADLSTGPIVEATALAGVALIAFAVRWVNHDVPFPGWIALLPTVGTALVIHAGPRAWINRRVLSNRIAVWIGLISYPLYLWHWPLLVYLHVVLGEAFGRGARMSAVLASFVLAVLTYLLVEKPLRHSRKERRGALALLGGMTLVATVGALAWSGTILPRQHGTDVEALATALGDWDYPGVLREEAYAGERLYVARGNRAGATLFFGDSHVEQYGPKVTSLLKGAGEAGNSVYFMTSGGCPPIPAILDRSGVNAGCRHLREAAFEFLKQRTVTSVVVGGCWNCYFIEACAGSQSAPDAHDFYIEHHGVREKLYSADGVATAMGELEVMLSRLAVDKRVYLLLDNPWGTAFNPTSFLSGTRLTHLSARPMTSTVEISPEQDQLRMQMKQVARRAGVTVIDPVEAMCPEGECIRAIGGVPIYKDNSHMRPFYVQGHAGFIDEAIQTSDGRPRQ